MVSGIGSIGGLNSSSSEQPLTPQTKAQLESYGIDTSSITTEAQGQAKLQSVQDSQQSDETQQTQGPQQGQPPPGEPPAIQSLKEQALELADKVGASVSSNDRLDEILDAIAQSLSTLQTEAANDPQKTAEVAQYQAQFDSICQQFSDFQSSMQAQAQASEAQIQASMTGMALYNIANMSMSNGNTGSMKQ